MNGTRAEREALAEMATIEARGGRTAPALAAARREFDGQTTIGADTATETVLIRCNSHRARRRMVQAIGEQQCFYSWDRACTGGFYRVTPAELDRLQAERIKGIRRARDGDDMHPCIELGPYSR